MPATWRDYVRPWVPPIVLKLAARAVGMRPVSYSALPRNPLVTFEEALPQATTLTFDLPVAPLGTLFPGADRLDVLMPMSQSQRSRSMVLPLLDFLVIGAICRSLRPRTVFEIGTYTGSTTLMIAANTPEDTVIYTLDLPPEQFTLADRAKFTIGSEFAGTPHSHKIRQLCGRSEEFDFTPYRDGIDLVFVDAIHTEAAVERDTVNAFQMLREGGVVIWDDYRWLPEHAECAGVTRYLNKLHCTVPCNQLEQTRLAARVGRPR